MICVGFDAPIPGESPLISCREHSCKPLWHVMDQLIHGVPHHFEMREGDLSTERMQLSSLNQLNLWESKSDHQGTSIHAARIPGEETARKEPAVVEVFEVRPTSTSGQEPSRPPLHLAAHWPVQEMVATWKS